jgi:hypothetical protein
MALAAPQQDFISDIGTICKALLDMQGTIQHFDILYNGSPDWDTLITDEEIDGVPLFAALGLTAANVADVIFQLNAIRTTVQTGNLPAMVVLSKVV